MARFLLTRAWKNKRIGHNLFWHLKSELDNPEVSLRFGLILETYLRGSPNHIYELQKQVNDVIHQSFGLYVFINVQSCMPVDNAWKSILEIQSTNSTPWVIDGYCKFNVIFQDLFLGLIRG